MAAVRLRALLGRRAAPLSGRLLADTLGTIALNVSSTSLNFAIVLLLTRLLGAAGYGAYASATAWVSVLAVVAVLGLTPLVVRHVAAYHVDEAWGLIRGLLRRANQAVVVASTITVASAAGTGLAVYADRPELLRPFLAALLLVPMVALVSIRQAALQGLGRVVLGRVPESLLWPLSFLALAASAHGALGDRFTPTVAVLSQAVTLLAAFAVGAWLLRRALPAGVRQAAPAYRTRSWRSSVLALLSLNLVMAANGQIGTIVLGAAGTAEDAGVFNVAFRVTTVISFVLLAAGYPLGPVIARLDARGDRTAIERTALRGARLVLLASIPIALVLLVFTSTVLGLFGSGFEDGAAAVRIIAVGDLVNVLTGFGGLVLVMCGREGDLARSVAVGAVLNVGLAAGLAPAFGVTGAAVATAASLAVSNVMMSALAWRRLGVWTFVLLPRPRSA